MQIWNSPFHKHNGERVWMTYTAAADDNFFIFFFLFKEDVLTFHLYRQLFNFSKKISLELLCESHIYYKFLLDSLRVNNQRKGCTAGNGVMKWNRYLWTLQRLSFSKKMASMPIFQKHYLNMPRFSDNNVICHSQISDIRKSKLKSKLSQHTTKPTKSHVRQAKTQIRLSAWRNLWSLATHLANSEDWLDWVDVQADLSLRWAHMPFCWFCRALA